MSAELIADARKHAQAAQYNASILSTLSTVMASTLPGFKPDAFDNLLAHLNHTTQLLSRCAEALSPTAQPSAKDGVRVGEDDARKLYEPDEYADAFKGRATTAAGLVDGLPAKWRETARIEMTFDSVEHKERAYALRKAADELEAAIRSKESK